MVNDVPPTPAVLFEAVQTIALSLEEASLPTLQETHRLIYEHYMRVLDRTQRSQQHAIEQRILGAMWAEFEMVIDERKRSSERRLS